MTSIPDNDPKTVVIPLLAEEMGVTRRTIQGSTVRVATVTQEREEVVDETLSHDRVEIERVPIGRTVAAVPPIREEGDTTIMPVVQEVVVVERRLVLKEEIRIRRVRGTQHHRESVVLRTQDAVITRVAAAAQPDGDGSRVLGTDHTPHLSGAGTMSEETIVAVYDTAAHADAAVRDLEAAHVPSEAISRHAKGAASGTTEAAAPAHEPGFWASLFGGESSDTTTYARSVESGSTVVTVKTVPQHDVARVSAILEKHNPIDFDERASSYGTGQTTATSTTAMPTMATGATQTGATQTGAMQTGTAKAAMPMATQTDDGMIQLAAESLTVGKRAVNRGTTRVRRYVVETPVEEQVSLHSEKVTVDRHPVADGRAVTTADFADRVIEMTETSEEAVVGKTARVVEEISLRKEGVDRVETVRDTLRHQEVEIEEIPAAGTAATTTTQTATRTDSATPPARPNKV